jgi:hypothetical protein
MYISTSLFALIGSIIYCSIMKTGDLDGFLEYSIIIVTIDCLECEILGGS